MSSDEVRRRSVTDPRVLRALSHPVRLSLLEVLDQDGPLTATEAGERIGESPANCSFHLRTLAKYGFVEEAEGGRGRQRPWRIRPVLTDINQDDLSAEGRVAAQALVEVLATRLDEWRRRWQATRDSYPEPWRQAAGATLSVLHLTSAELAEVSATLQAAVERYVGREDPPDALPVAISLQAFPLRPPRTDRADTPPTAPTEEA